MIAAPRRRRMNGCTGFLRREPFLNKALERLEVPEPRRPRRKPRGIVRRVIHAILWALGELGERDE